MCRRRCINAALVVSVLVFLTSTGALALLYARRGELSLVPAHSLLS